MKYSKEYFQHDYNARNSFQLQALMLECGEGAYGIFWAVVEVLHEKRNKVPMKDYVYAGIAEQIKTNQEKVKKVIETCINLELFKKSYGNFYSPRVKANIIKRLELSKSRSNASKKRQSKVKESKIKEIESKDWDSIKENFFNAFGWQDDFCKTKKISPVILVNKMHEFISDIELKEDFKDLKELKKHFTNLFNKNGSHQQISGAGAKLGTSDARIEKARTWG